MIATAACLVRTRASGPARSTSGSAAPRNIIAGRPETLFTSAGSMPMTSHTDDSGIA